ncbi:hypothetical protein REH65_33165 (plasmid) [Saccharopolyspora sp. ID03-671]|uniref:hypothetical protein n=1 Tax=Saccharopolyspora sp. ID03-671 TaxID=3073066 RepID=UPI003255A616
MSAWILHKGTYIRSSEIIEVEVRRTSVYITQARVGDRQVGTVPESRTLWEFETHEQAVTAADELLAVLATDPPALVSLRNGEVEVRQVPAVSLS